jgi:hypothetical protein
MWWWLFPSWEDSLSLVQPINQYQVPQPCSRQSKQLHILLAGGILGLLP